jgi:hypothetical protein
VHHIRRRRADAGFLIFLVAIEGTPLGAMVDLVFLNDESAVTTDRFAVLGVGCQLAVALRTAERLFGVGRLRLLGRPIMTPGVLVGKRTNVVAHDMDETV